MDSPTLQPHSQIRCPNCRSWHVVMLGHPEGTDYAVRMLYFECRGGRYYAGHGRAESARSEGRTFQPATRRAGIQPQTAAQALSVLRFLHPHNTTIGAMMTITILSDRNNADGTVGEAELPLLVER